VAGGLLDAAGLELASQRAISLQPGERRALPVAFDGEPLVSLIVLTDQPAALSASLFDLPLEKGDLLGVPAFFITLQNPHDGELMLENTGRERAAVAVETRVQTARTISVEIDPSVVAPDGRVALLATVTEPEADDVVRLRVVRDGSVIAQLRPEQVSEGTWHATFSASKPGFYAVAARVDGASTRFSQGTVGFEVADQGSRILGFSDRLVDADHNGRAEALAVRVDLVVAKAGYYLLTVGLGDENGTPLAAGAGSGGDGRLSKGRHTVELRWGAEALRLVGIPGPWHLVNAELVRVRPDYRTQAAIPDLGTTHAYPLSKFE
jgi:hypothetical protein